VQNGCGIAVGDFASGAKPAIWHDSSQRAGRPIWDNKGSDG
jgi:hypothetical protein